MNVCTTSRKKKVKWYELGRYVVYEGGTTNEYIRLFYWVEEGGEGSGLAARAASQLGQVTVDLH